MKLKRATAIAGIAALFICLAMLPPSSARAAESIRLIAVDSDSSSSLWVRVFLEHFIPEVDRRLAEADNYEIEWNPAFGGTLAKPRGVLTTLQYDLADIGIVTTPYHPDKIPFYSLPYVTPFVSNDIGLIARTMTELTNKYPQVKDVWQNYNLHYLTSAGSIDTYNIVLTDPVESIADLQGIKIGGVGLALLFLEGSGAVGVVSALPDWYNNMATGLMSGSVVWAEAAAAYRFYEVAPYMLDIRFGGAASKAIAINQRTWDRLPEEVQIVIQDVANDYRDQLALETDRISSHAREVFNEQGGITIPVSEDQRMIWASNLPDLAGDWVKVMTDAGLPGQEILADYMQIMRDNDQPVMRQWDQ
jgi:TRAP-type C4-dicarboxylate transport system substrate-binding protein